MTESMDEFNNRFKESAENFLLIPSARTWLNVEDAIRKRERKRRFIIFFFGIAVLTGGIFLFMNNPLTIKEVSDPGNVSLSAVEQEQIQHQNAVTTNAQASDVNSNTPLPVISKNSSGPVTSHKQETQNSDVTTTGPSRNHLSIIDSVQHEADVTIVTTVSPASMDSIPSDLAVAIGNDTLYAGIKTDSLLHATSDTAGNDTTILAKMKQGKWSIVSGVAPTLSFTQPGEKGDHQFISNYRDSTDKTLLTWNYHFALCYKIVPSLEIFTGMGIANFEQEVLNKQIVYDYDTMLVPVVGPANPDTVIILNKSGFNINGDSTGTVKNRFSYIEIPVGFRFSFLAGRKFNIVLQPGISFNKVTRSEGYRYNFETFTYEKIKPADVKKWLIAYGAGISFQYHVQKSLCIEFTPYYKNYNKSVFKDHYAYSQSLQQVEFRASLKYIFK